jgi:hypothetical protein
MGMDTIAMPVLFDLGLWLAVSGGLKRRIARTAAGIILAAGRANP